MTGGVKSNDELCAGSGNVTDPEQHTELHNLTEDQNDPAHVYHAARIKTQEFFTSDPELWFFLLESQFVVHRISSDITMYHTVVSQLNQTVAEKVRTFLRQPPATGRYLALKQKLIKEFTPSDQGKIKKLLSQMELGDKKPSRLLEEMRNLAGDTVEDKFLATLWLGCLPMTLQQILSPWSDEPLDKVAKMADGIVETTNLVSVAAASSSHNHNSRMADESLLERLTARMDDMCRRFQLLEKRGRRDRTPSRPRQRNTSQQRSEPRAVCWYHHKFGSQATKCRAPCSFMSGN